MIIIERLRLQIRECVDKIKEIQEACSHLLSARHTKNARYSGHYDDPGGSYWTNHTCGLCELKCATDQNWKTVGDGLGLPKKEIVDIYPESV